MTNAIDQSIYNIYYLGKRQNGASTNKELVTVWSQLQDFTTLKEIILWKANTNSGIYRIYAFLFQVFLSWFYVYIKVQNLNYYLI